MPEHAPPQPSWIPNAETSDGFGLNHLPYGAIDDGSGAQLHARIAEFAFNLHAAAANGLFAALPQTLIAACSESNLNALLALGRPAWEPLRARLQQLLGTQTEGADRERAGNCLRSLSGARLVLPIKVGDYTDFYASPHHARRVGELFRPDAPLLPNYKHLPIAYHGRASSLILSGTPVRRPWGQSRPSIPGGSPGFAPSSALDFETELAFVIGPGNPLGTPINIRDAEDHLFGAMLLNDWSARDLQSWEYQPLGPFLGKSFATSIAAWITPLAALEPFRRPFPPRAPEDPEPLEYLGRSTPQSTFNIAVSTCLRAEGQDFPIARASATDLYWSPAQMVAHHTSNGCNLRPGDLLATGTISGAAIESAGCLLERTSNGTIPLELAPGLNRLWLQDGDEVLLEAVCRRPGFATVQLGSCTGQIEPVLP